VSCEGSGIVTALAEVTRVVTAPIRRSQNLYHFRYKTKIPLSQRDSCGGRAWIRTRDLYIISVTL
jgi:hypothetical protein